MASTGGDDSAMPDEPAQALDLRRLSPAERRVLDHVLAGRSAREIAELLVLSEATVRSHLSRIYAKLDVRGQVELLARASATIPTDADGSPDTTISPQQRPAARASSAPLVVLLVGLAALSVIPPVAVVVGPGLLIGAWLAGRAADDTAVRRARPWLFVVGLIVTIWAALVILAFVGLVAVGTGSE